MLTKLGRRDHELREEPAAYGDHDHHCDNDNDNDSDNDSDNEGDWESQPMGAG